MKHEPTVGKSMLAALPAFMVVAGALLGLVPIVILLSLEDGVSANWGLLQRGYMLALSLGGNYLLGQGLVFMLSPAGESTEDGANAGVACDAIAKVTGSAA